MVQSGQKMGLDAKYPLMIDSNCQEGGYNLNDESWIHEVNSLEGNQEKSIADDAFSTVDYLMMALIVLGIGLILLILFGNCDKEEDSNERGASGQRRSVELPRVRKEGARERREEKSTFVKALEDMEYQKPMEMEEENKLEFPEDSADEGN